MKSLTESLKKGICESKSFPKNNIVCPAEDYIGNPIVVIGEPFTLKDRSSWQKAFNLVKSIFPKKEIGWGWDSIDGINGMMADSLDPDFLDDDGILSKEYQLVYAHNPEFLGNREGSIAVFMLDQITIL